MKDSNFFSFPVFFAPTSSGSPSDFSVMPRILVRALFTLSLTAACAFGQAPASGDAPAITIAPDKP